METDTGTAIRAAPKMITLSIATPPVYGCCPHFAKTTVANFIANAGGGSGAARPFKDASTLHTQRRLGLFHHQASRRRELLYVECEHGNPLSLSGQSQGPAQAGVR